MIEIAQNSAENGVLQKDIAINQNISIKYLDHIVAALKSSGLIVCAKGKKSGYVLTRQAAAISMLDIHNAFEKEICVIDCMALNYKCERENTCKTKKFWKGLNVLVYDYFRNTTLENLIKQN
jgi:Rrf2 family protein